MLGGFQNCAAATVQLGQPKASETPGWGARDRSLRHLLPALMLITSAAVSSVQGEVTWEFLSL